MTRLPIPAAALLAAALTACAVWWPGWTLAALLLALAPVGIGGLMRAMGGGE